MKNRFSIKVWLIDSFEQILQLLALVVVIFLPYRFDFQTVVKIKQPGMDIQQLAAYYALRHGKICISILLAVLMILCFHKINGDKVLNTGNRYHRRTMVGYWIYSHILGYGKCSLIRVPIADQFKLILSDMFNEYELGQYDEPCNEDNISIRKYGSPMHSELILQNSSSITAEIKLEVDNIYIAISDTYPITEVMLPSKCDANNTIIIQREANKADNKRYKSKALTRKVLNVLKHIDRGLVVNILPTTNVINTFEIVNEVFKTGGQDNIKHLYIYSQLHDCEGNWFFSEKGIKIY